MNYLKTLLVLFYFLGCGGMGDTTPQENRSTSGSSPSSGNAKLIFSDNFEGGKSKPGWTAVNFTEENYKNVPKFKQIEGKWAAHYHLLGGENATNEQQPLMIIKDDFTDWFGSAEVEELYIEHYEYWDTNYDSPTGSQKMVRIGRFTQYNPDGPFLDFWSQIANTNLQIYHYFRGENDSVDNNLFNNLNYGTEKGKWVKYGNWVKLNSKGNSNGFVRLYINDELSASLEDTDMRGNSSLGYRFFWIGGNATYWQPDITGGHPARPIRDSSRYIADIKVYNTKP